MNDVATAAGPRTRKMFWTMVGMFFAPLALAFLLYYGLDGWRPHGSTNKGDLVTPPRPLPAATLRAPDGDLQIDSLKGKWTLVYIGNGACDARCREALMLMRQTRLALNDDMSRIQRLFLAAGECCDQAYLGTEHSGLVIGQVDGDTPLLQLFARGTEEVGQAGRIYIVDPLNNLMMSYEPGAPPKALLEDLKKLLKLSHIG